MSILLKGNVAVITGVASLHGLGFASTRMLALADEFLDAGALPTLHDRYGISAEKMNSRIKGWLA
jgi:transketolase